MKRLFFISIAVLNSIAMDTPPATPSKESVKRVLTYTDESEEERNIQFLTPTSPSRPGFMTPEKTTPRSKRTRTQGADTGHSTEALSEVEKRIAKIPAIIRIKNLFNYPIMISYPSYPRPTTAALYPGEHENIKEGIKLSLPDSIMINANNRNHIFKYADNKFIHYINKTVTGSVEIDAAKAEIIVDRQGDVSIKVVSE